MFPSTKKTIACLLVLCLILSCVPGSIFARATDTVQQPGAVTTAPFQLDADCRILQYVNEEVFHSGNHVARLKEEETLSTYVFLNADGTRTVYYMDENVKFRDENGEIQEKDIALTATAQGYTTVRNNIQLSLPASLKQGVTLSFSGYDVNLVPEDISLGTTVQRQEGKVAYLNCYGKGTGLIYTPTLTGFKEDILLGEYTGVSSFSFLLNTDGLNVYQNEQGRYYLAAAEDAGTRMEMADIVAYDANARHSLGSVTVTPITVGQQYRLTVAVDEEFLTAETTAYPVLIDPSITVSDNTHGAGAIEDASVYSLKPNMNAGTWTYNHAGYYDSTYGVARTAVRLTDLLSSSEYTSFGRDDVLSAKFYITEATGSAPANVKLHALTGNSTWTESNVTWNSVGAYSSTVYATASMSYDQTAEFDITNLVKSWKGGYFGRGQCGFLLIGENETSIDKALYSSEYGTTSKRPYVTVTYSSDTFGSVYYLNNLFTGEFIRYDSTSSQNLYCAPGQVSESGPYMRWRLTRTEKGYTIRPILDTSKCLAVTNGAVSLVTIYSTETIPDNCVWVFTQISGDQYTIRNFGSAGYLNSTGAGLSATSESVAPNSDEQKARTWRMATASEYGASSAYAKRELKDFSANNLYLAKGGKGDLSISTKDPSSALWSNLSDFEFEVMKTKYSEEEGIAVSISGTEVTAPNETGICTLLVTHKVTGIQRVMAVVVRDTSNQLTFDIVHRPDEGFIVRYGNTTLMTEAAAFVEKKLEQFFGISVTTTIISETYESVPDSCIKGKFGYLSVENLTSSQCDHGGNHFNTTFIMDDQDWVDGDETTASVVWTGHDVGSSVSHPTKYKVLITPLKALEYTTYEGRLKSYICTLWHELSHQLGAPDHYCYKDNGENSPCTNENCYSCNNNGAEAPWCLMTTAQDFVDALDSPDIYCASCREVISQHLLSHHFAE